MPDRDDISALIPEDASREIIKGITNKSAARQLFRKVEMKANQRRLPIIEVLPDGAGYLSTDTGVKPISEVEWTNKYLDARPLATILYLPEDVVDDFRDGGGGDIWDQIRPLIEDDLARKLDDAIFFGVNKPSAWPTDIQTAAVAAGNTVNAGAGADIFHDINTAISTIEADGYEYTGAWARNQFKGSIRNARDGNQGFLYPPTGPANTGAARAAIQGELFGEKLAFSKAGLTGMATASGKAHMIVGDWDQGMIGIRKDFRWKMLDQASLYNTDGTLRIALAQQDSVAIRVVGRFAFQVPNPINRMQATEANRYPFAVVRQP